MAPHIAASHIYLWGKGDDESWDHIPDSWKNIRFSAVDILYVSPFLCYKDGSFGLPGITALNRNGDLFERFRWVVKEARKQNSLIKIIAMQWWGSEGNFSLLKTDNMRETYAKSVKDFLKLWHDKTDPETKISLRVDGWDVDYEGHPNVDAGGNVQTYVPDILSKIRREVDKLSSELKIARFQVSITAATSNCLQNIPADVLDYVNMQNYDGGLSSPPEDYFEAIPGLNPSKLLWGISSELTEKNDQSITSIDAAVSKMKEDHGPGTDGVKKGPLGGIMMWRLNSDNWVFENIAQISLYNKIHSKASPVDKFDKQVQDGWNSNGGRVPQNPNDPNAFRPTKEPWRPEDWKTVWLPRIGSGVSK